MTTSGVSSKTLHNTNILIHKTQSNKVHTFTDTQWGKILENPKESLCLPGVSYELLCLMPDEECVSVCEYLLVSPGLLQRALSAG